MWDRGRGYIDVGDKDQRGTLSGGCEHESGVADGERLRHQQRSEKRTGSLC